MITTVTVAGNAFGLDMSKVTSLMQRHNKFYTQKGVNRSITMSTGESAIINQILSEEELLGVINNALLNPKTNFDKVVNDLCCLGDDRKFVGAEFVARYTKDKWSNVSSFEIDDLGNGNRFVDIRMVAIPTDIECKSWAYFGDYMDQRFAKELSEDLNRVDKLEKLKWVFDAKGSYVRITSGTFNTAMLKNQVSRAMKDNKDLFDRFLDDGTDPTRFRALFNASDEQETLLDSNIDYFINTHFNDIFVIE